MAWAAMPTRSAQLGESNEATGGTTTTGVYDCKITKVVVEIREVGPIFYDLDGFAVMGEVALNTQETATLNGPSGESNTTVKRTNPAHTFANSSVSKVDHLPDVGAYAFLLEFKDESSGSPLILRQCLEMLSTLRRICSFECNDVIKIRTRVSSSGTAGYRIG